MNRLARLVTFATLAVAVGPLAAAPPSVESVAPGVGQRGSEFTLTLTGGRLADPQEVLFYSTGVTCTKLTAVDENEVTITLTAAADCPLGEHPFRLRTRGGASELRVFRITPLPVVAEVEPNDRLTEAQVVPLGRTVTGVIESSDVDSFKITLKKGERLTAEVEGVRLANDMLDAVLTVFGPDGSPLATVDDTPLFRQDPFVSLLAPADGQYTVQVRDTAFGGGDTYRYALHLGHYPRPVAIYPLGAQEGTDTRVSFVGDSLTQTVRPLAQGRFELFTSDGTDSAPTSTPFRVSPFPNVLEVEPNDTTETATPAKSWPVAFNGVIRKKGDADHFRFTAKNGDTIDVEAFGFRLGTLVDTVVGVYDANGQLLARNDDDATQDSRLTFTAPADGEYTVRVTDKRGDGGPEYVYRVELRNPEPGLVVFMPAPERKTQAGQVIAIPRGNKVTAFLAVRRDGCEGEVSISPTSLPSGVNMTPVTVPEGRYFVPVVFEAAVDARPSGELVELTGMTSATDGQVRGTFNQRVDLLLGPGDTSYHTVAVDRLTVVVVDEVPLGVALTPPVTPLVADGALDVGVRVDRRKGFDGAVEVALSLLPPGVEVGEPLVIPADKSEGVIRLQCQPGTELGEWPLVATAKPARARVDRRTMTLQLMSMIGSGSGRPRAAPAEFIPVASEAVALTIASPVVEGKIAPVACEQGASLTVVCQLDRPLPEGSRFRATLTGLPPTATSVEVDVPANGTISFPVKISSTTAAVEYPSLVCELKGEANGQPVVYRIGRGGVLTVYPPGGVKTGPNGEPLSPLEALRQQNKNK